MYGDFCANDDNNNTTDYFTPCACARGNYTKYDKKRTETSIKQLNKIEKWSRDGKIKKYTNKG